MKGPVALCSPTIANFTQHSGECVSLSFLSFNLHFPEKEIESFYMFMDPCTYVKPTQVFSIFFYWFISFCYQFERVHIYNIQVLVGYVYLKYLGLCVVLF